jgi:hypothetical protein
VTSVEQVDSYQALKWLSPISQSSEFSTIHLTDALISKPIFVLDVEPSYIVKDMKHNFQYPTFI